MADQPQKTPEKIAIAAALAAHWDEAINANLQILETDPHNLAALNRLGIAYLKNRQPGNARKTFQQVLKIDPFNTIAKTNLKKTSAKFSKEFDTTSILSNHTFSFIEEPGKSKVVPLTNIGEPNVIGSLYTGLPVDLKVAARRIKVTKDNQYIGSLPDDIARHLIKLIRAGYKYTTLIKSVDTGSVQVFIKETKSSKKLKGIPSFTNSHNLDDIDIAGGNISGQPPLEIYDPVVENES